LLAQPFYLVNGDKIVFKSNGQSECGKFNWIISPKGVLTCSAGEETYNLSLVWSNPVMNLVKDNQEIAASTSRDGAKE